MIIADHNDFGNDDDDNADDINHDNTNNNNHIESNPNLLKILIRIWW